MYHQINISDSIILDKILEGDAQSIVRHINDNIVFENTVKIPSPYSIEDAHEFIKHVRVFEQENKLQKDWAIRIHGEFAGAIGLVFNFGINSHKSEIGYWIGKPWREKGIMRQVIKDFTDFCFSTYQLVRIEAHVFIHNKASEKVLINNDFIKEGLITAAFLKDGKYKDAFLYSKLSPQYQ